MDIARTNARKPPDRRLAADREHLRMFRKLPATVLLAAIAVLVSSQSALAAHAVRHSGTGTIKGTWCADCDAGILNSTNDPASDLCFDVVNETERYLETWHTPDRILKMGTTRPSYAKCASAALLNVDYRVKPKLEGKWFCYKMGTGRFARFRLDDVHPYPGGIDVTYTTWEL
jgi:hypothetical protein